MPVALHLVKQARLLCCVLVEDVLPLGVVMIVSGVPDFTLMAAKSEPMELTRPMPFSTRWASASFWNSPTPLTMEFLLYLINL